MTMAGEIARDAALAATIVAPDFARRIDLPGAGPCPRPVDIDRSTTGFAKLVSLRVYSFAKGMDIHGEAEGDEVFIVLMRGQADIAVDRAGNRVGEFSLRPDGGLRAVYLPPHAAYHLTAVSDCDIAYARVEPVAARLPEARGFAPDGDRLDIIGFASGMDLAFAKLHAGDEIALAGRDGGSPERFVHVRFGDDAAARMSDEPIGDWDSAIVADGEAATLAIEGGDVNVLTISASPKE